MKKYVNLSIILFIGLFLSCSKKDNPVDQNTQLTNQNFTGTATTKIQYYDYDPYSGQDVFVEEKSYQYAVLIYVKSPLNVGSVYESNPVNLAIYPDRDATAEEEGHIDISSAIIINDPLIGKVLLQYWNLTLNGNSISGTLTDNHIAEASATNLLWAWDAISANLIMTMPFPIAVSTTMQGTIGSNQIQLNISGQSHNTYRRFTSNIVASIAK